MIDSSSHIYIIYSVTFSLTPIFAPVLVSLAASLLSFDKRRANMRVKEHKEVRLLLAVESVFWRHRRKYENLCAPKRPTHRCISLRRII